MRRKTVHLKNYVIFFMIAGAGALSYFYSTEVYTFYMQTFYEKILGQSVEQQVAIAEGMYENRQYAELKDYLHSRVMVYPDNMDMKKLDGLARIKLGEEKRGIDMLLTASGSERMPEKLLVETVGQLFEQGRYRDIIEIFRKNSPGDNPGLLYQYGVALFETGNTAGAIRELKKAMDEGRTDYEAYHYLGRAYAKQGDYRAALPYLERAHDLNDNDPDVTRSLADAYRALGRYKDSARLLRSIRQ
jgi:tetratricopeptide (TPR) repeat protein